MSLYSLGDIRSQVAQYAGIRNTQGLYDMDATTFPNIDLGNKMINDSIREIAGDWEYTFLETTKSYPFYHVISGVQAIDLVTTNASGVVVASGSITPYPNDVLNYSWLAHNSVNDMNSNFSGISYVGTSGSSIFTGLSTSGIVTTHNWTGVGYTYQLDADIDKFYVPGVYVPHSNNGNSAQGVLIKNIDFEDMIRIFPIGTTQASGTPIYFSEAPGLSITNGKSIVFGPAPTTTAYSGNNFVCFYKKTHIDMVLDTDTQNMFPQQWQNVIVKMATAKTLQISDPSRAESVG